MAVSDPSIAVALKEPQRTFPGSLVAHGGAAVGHLCFLYFAPDDPDTIELICPTERVLTTICDAGAGARYPADDAEIAAFHGI